MAAKIKVFEMFSGFGGATFALTKAGIDHEVIGYSEINNSAIEIYKKNHGDNIKNYGDCSKIDVKDLPDFDLLTGGFPCQPFSVNTNCSIRGEKHKSSNLFLDILRILDHKQPKYFLLENVKGILGAKSKPIYNEIVKGLKDLGYDVQIHLANSKEHGVPQSRERVYFIGVLGTWDNYKFPDTVPLTITVKDILEHNVSRRTPQISRLKLSNKNKFRNLDRFGDISRLDAILQSPVKKSNSNVAFEILDAPSEAVSRQSDRIYHPTYSPCLTATGKDYLFYVDGSVIVLTPRECFRLMGFLNDEINIEGFSDGQLHKLAGNGWDINLVSKIFSSMKMTLDKNGTEEVKVEDTKVEIIETNNKTLLKVNEMIDQMKGEIFRLNEKIKLLEEIKSGS